MTHFVSVWLIIIFGSLYVNLSFLAANYPPECGSQTLLDLIFILDSSGSVYDEKYINWQSEIDFAKSIVNNSLPRNTKIGAINFSGCGPSYDFEQCKAQNRLKKMWGLNTYGVPYNDQQAVYDRFAAMGPADFNNGYTWTDSALSIALNEFNGNGSAYREKMVILLTDGQPYPYNQGHEPCKNSTGYISPTLASLRAIGTTIIAIGIDVSQSAIDDFFSCITIDFNKYFFYVSDFYGLTHLTKKVRGLVCPTPAPTSAPTVPSESPTPAPTSIPTVTPTSGPTSPSLPPSQYPTMQPSTSTMPPTPSPTNVPTSIPTGNPTDLPTTSDPTISPITSPPSTASPTTAAPTFNPTKQPTTTSPTTSKPTTNPTTATPTTVALTFSPTKQPTTTSPTTPRPTMNPITSKPTTAVPTTSDPTTAAPTTSAPTLDPTQMPTEMPSMIPTLDPTGSLSTGKTTTDDPTTTARPTTSIPTTASPTPYQTKIQTAVPTRNPSTEETKTSTPTTSEPTTSEPTTSEPTTNSPTLDNCQVNNSLDNEDCDETDNEPKDECSILAKISFDVCYIDAYKNARLKLWSNFKSCLCGNAFIGTEYDDNKRKCFIEKYLRRNVIKQYIADGEANNGTNCVLQESFEFTTAIFDDSCNYIKGLYSWLLGAAQYIQILDKCGKCNMFYSRQINKNHPHGFGAISNAQIQLILRDQQRNAIEQVITDKGISFRLMMTLIMILMMLLIM